MSGPEVIATTTELPESRVRLEATVPVELLDRAVERAAKQVGRNMRIPGFRAGKVPPKLVVQRVGREAIVDEAIRADFNEWYDKAIRAAKIQPIGQPTVDEVEMPEEGKPFVFSAEVGVVPILDGSVFKDLEVGKAELSVDDDAVDRELDLLRERFARLETVERKAEEGDYVVVDFVGKLDGEAFEGGEAKNQMIELGAKRFIPGFEEQIIGLAAGDEKLVEVTFPEDYSAEHLAGQDAVFELKLTEVKAKELPALDDDFALEVGGVDTLDELRKDVASRLGEAEETRLEQLFRLATLDAAAQKAGVEVPQELAHEHAHQEFHRMMHRFEHQGISQDVYLQSVGKTHDEVVDEAVPSAAAQIKRQAVALAVIEAEGVAATDEELEEAIAPFAAQEKTTVKKAWQRLQNTGQLDALRRDLAESKAVDLLVERAKAITVDAAKKAGTPYTPSRAEQDAEPGLWNI